MSTTTHYTALGLVPTAAPEVIRAAYKALALVCHPDKTIHLTTSERASHAAAFNEVQAAYDVLGKPSLKAAYDARLSFQMDNVDRYHSASRGPFQARNASEASSTPKHSATVKLTTPEERTAMRAKARQSLDVLRQKRTERDTHEAQLGVVDLRGLVQTWTQLAEENRADPAMHAHCAIRIHEYEQKIAERERQHEEWLINMSTAKQETTTPTSKPRHTTRDAPKTSTPLRSTGSIPSSSASHSSVCRPSPMSTTPTPQARIGRVEERKRAEAERSAAAAARCEAGPHGAKGCRRPCRKG
jgi:curved DNA-binding protein CbpA